MSCQVNNSVHLLLVVGLPAGCQLLVCRLL